MFCCIYQFALQTKNNTYQYKDCTSECPHFKDGKCSLMSFKDKKLDTERFGSILKKTIKFSDGYKCFGNNKAIAASLIIHPINPDIWVVKISKPDGTIMYKMVHIGSGARDASDLDDLNKKLKKWVKTDLLDSDFELCN